MPQVQRPKESSSAATLPSSSPLPSRTSVAATTTTSCSSSSSNGIYANKAVDLTDDSTDYMQQVLAYESKFAANFHSVADGCDGCSDEECECHEEDRMYAQQLKTSIHGNDNQVCPICNLLIPAHLMNSHVDKCLLHNSPTAASKSSQASVELADDDDDIQITGVTQSATKAEPTTQSANSVTSTLKYITNTALPPLSLTVAACQLCSSELSIDLLVQSKCGHSVCLQCCNDKLSQRIPKPADASEIDVTEAAKEQQDSTLASQCLMDGCHQPLEPADIVRALHSAQQRSLFKHLIDDFVSSLTQQHHCPHCNAKQPKLSVNTVLSLKHIDSLRSMISDTADSTAECRQCNQPICSLCPERKLTSDDRQHASNCARQAAFYLYMCSEVLQIAQIDKPKDAKASERAAATAAKSSLKTPTKTPRKRRYVEPEYDSDGYEIEDATSLSAKKGTGYGGRSNENSNAKNVLKKLKQISAADQQRDKTIQLTLDLTTQVLRRFDSLKYTSDVLVYALMSNTYIRSTLIAVLRNDSIVDMSSRLQLHLSTLQLVSAIAATPPLASTLLVLRPLLASLSKQAKFFLSHSASNLMTEESNSLGLCADINDITQRVDDSMGQLKFYDIEDCQSLLKCTDPASGSRNDKQDHVDATNSIMSSPTPAKRSRRIKAAESSNLATVDAPAIVLTEAEKQIAATALKQLADLKFDTHTIIDDYKSSVDKSYYFAHYVVPNVQPAYKEPHHHLHYPTLVGGKSAKAETSNASKNFASKSRDTSNRLRKELSTLASGTALPDGVYVRVDESRMDVLRFMLTGPSATPYSYGCYLFDVFIPDTYPLIPPKVQLMTTGQNTFRFNPNLYADGKVCLSLLGTWNGPGWDPKVSTILQVIISIQSMILIDKPYFNEPGYQSSEGTPHGEAQSNAYNRAVRHGTLQYAMLDIIRSPPRGFEEIVRQHFLAHRSDILQLAGQWDQEETVMAEKEEAARAEAKARYEQALAEQQQRAAALSTSSKAVNGTVASVKQKLKSALKPAKMPAAAAAAAASSSLPPMPTLPGAHFGLSPATASTAPSYLPNGVTPLLPSMLPPHYPAPVNYDRHQQVVPVAVKHIVVNLKAELQQLVKQNTEPGATSCKSA